VDYNQNLPEARDHEVLDTMTAIIRKLGVHSVKVFSNAFLGQDHRSSSRNHELRLCLYS
jgi:hypothetical protein